MNRVANAARWAIRLVERLDRALPLVVDVVRAIRDYGFKDVYRGTMRIIASLDRYPIFRFANWLTTNRLPARKSAYSSVAIDNCAPLEPLAPRDEVPSVLCQAHLQHSGRTRSHRIS